MSKPIIEIKGISKKYALSHQAGRSQYVALRDKLSPDYLLKKLSGKLPKQSAEKEDFWALRDVSFEVQQGEAVGIIGRNGAGKSTLLKVLSKIVSPTEGEIILRGRVASLLEVGTGFHPELTGRENIYLNGAILGMRRKEIERKFDEIVDFAGVEKFLDTPVKRYSSGMYVRLAFAVAAHLEPEILIVDEVLAVGDAEFQKKCLGKMQDVSAKEGRTILFVSHDMQAISTLTKEVVLLGGGKLQSKGDTEKMIECYISQSSKELRYTCLGESRDNKPRITRVDVFTSEPNNIHICEKEFIVEIGIQTPFPVRNACLSVQIMDRRQINYIHMWTFDSEKPMCREKGSYVVRCVIPKLRLYMGMYKLKIYFTEPPGGDVFQIIEDVCPFEVVMYGRPREFQWQNNACAYLEEGQWEIIKE